VGGRIEVDGVTLGTDNRETVPRHACNLAERETGERDQGVEGSGRLLNPLGPRLRLLYLDLGGTLEGERMRRLSTLIVLPLFPSLMTLLPATAHAAEKVTRAGAQGLKEARQKLPEKYKQWLKGVDLLISEQEIKPSWSSRRTDQRDASCRQFWKPANPNKGGGRNSFQRSSGRPRWSRPELFGQQWTRGTRHPAAQRRAQTARIESTASSVIGRSRSGLRPRDASASD